MAKYPRVVKGKATTSMRPGLKLCVICKKYFKKDEYFTVEETQTSWFRGDDEVVAYHYTCEEAVK